MTRAESMRSEAKKRIKERATMSRMAREEIEAQERVRVLVAATTPPPYIATGTKLSQSPLLMRMRAENTAAGFPFIATYHWQLANADLNSFLDQIGIGDVETQRYNAYFSTYPERNSAIYSTYAHWMYYHYIKARNPAVFDTARPAAGNIHYLDGVYATWDMLLSLDTLTLVNEHVPILNRPMTLVDLGAGWGRIGHTLRQLNPQSRYIICDLPESLFIALNYLPRFLSDCHPYGELGTDPGVYFLGSQDIAKLDDASVDVVVNIASFQEMTPEQIIAYMRIIETKARYFYTLQRHHAQSSLAHWHELLKRNMFWSGEYYEALYETKHEV